MDKTIELQARVNELLDKTRKRWVTLRLDESGLEVAPTAHPNGDIERRYGNGSIYFAVWQVDADCPMPSSSSHPLFQLRCTKVEEDRPQAYWMIDRKTGRFSASPSPWFVGRSVRFYNRDVRGRWYDLTTKPVTYNARGGFWLADKLRLEGAEWNQQEVDTLAVVLADLVDALRYDGANHPLDDFVGAKIEQ